jgi:hypothetical protein
MSTEPFTYERWLTLTAEEREPVVRTWNPYAGQNIQIPKEAGRRFMQRFALPIVNVRVGIYHMGEYILNPCVSTFGSSRRSSFHGCADFSSKRSSTTSTNHPIAHPELIWQSVQ